MFEGKYSKVLTILLIVGIIIIVGVVGFLGFTVIKDGILKAEGEEAVERFQGKINAIQNESTPMENNVNNVVENEVTPIIGLENIVTPGNSSNENKEKYKGFPMVGTIEIPSTKLKCPILETTSKSAIEVAVAIYYGVGLNNVGNTTIVGHNYRNGTFFSNNKKITVGDKIYITDYSGKKITYIVYNTYITSPEDSSYLERDTKGKREISLLTCTDDAKSRLVVFAKEN